MLRLVTLHVFYRNLLSVNVHSVYSVPDSWQPGGYPYTFTIALPMPISDDVRLIISVTCFICTSVHLHKLDDFFIGRQSVIDSRWNIEE